MISKQVWQFSYVQTLTDLREALAEVELWAGTAEVHLTTATVVISLIEEE